MEAIEHKKPEDDETNTKDEIKDEENRLVSLLDAIGYTTREYSNGILMGVDLRAIPGSRGVQIDIVNVIDLRNAKFGKTPIAMQSTILESINRKVEYCLADAGFGDIVDSREFVSPHGRRDISILKSKSGRVSALHETRSVYVVYEEETARPKNLDWLTDSSRIIATNEFSLIQKSDSRSLQQEVKNAVVDKKWKDLATAYRTSWMSILPLIVAIASLIGISASLITGSGSLLLPSVAAMLSLPSFIYLYRKADSQFAAFDQALNIELNNMALVGDGARISETAKLHNERLKLVGDLKFIITPLMGGAIVALESRDLDAAVSSLIAILDECVLHSPLEKEPIGGEKGLKKFEALFEELGLENDDELMVDLNLAYVAISGHLQHPLSMSDLLKNSAKLAQGLFDCGILSREIKDSFDDNLNLTSMKQYLDEHPMPEDVPIAPIQKTGDELESTSETSGIDEDALKEMAAAGIQSESESETPESQPDITKQDTQESPSKGIEPNLNEEETVLVDETVQTKLTDDISKAEFPTTGLEVVEKVRSERKQKRSRAEVTKKESEPIKA